MEFLEYMVSLPSLGGALALGLGNVLRIVVKHNKNNRQESAETYVSNDNFDILKKSENFVRTYEEKVKVTSDKK